MVKWEKEWSHFGLKLIEKEREANENSIKKLCEDDENETDRYIVDMQDWRVDAQFELNHYQPQNELVGFT